MGRRLSSPGIVQCDHPASSLVTEHDRTVQAEWRLEDDVVSLKSFRSSAVSRRASPPWETDVLRGRFLSTPRKEPDLSPSDESCTTRPGELVDGARGIASHAGGSLIHEGEAAHTDKTMAIEDDDIGEGRVTVSDGVVGGPRSGGSALSQFRGERGELPGGPSVRASPFVR
jgi:hypothetical protein